MSRVYVANADDQDITVFDLDAGGGLRGVATVAMQTPPQTGRSMVLATDPAQRLLYAAFLRDGHFAVATFAPQPGAAPLRHLGTAQLADTMAYLSTDRSGRYLLGASYGGNRITVNAIGADGCVGALVQDIPTAPKAHCILPDVANRHVLYTSLGGDRVYRHAFDAASGALGPEPPATLAMPPQSGPRFLALSADGRKLYVNGELDGSVSVHPFDSVSGALLPSVQCISVLPDGFAGKPWAADLKLTPDGRHLYVSERTGSTIAAFAVEAGSGMLRRVGIVPAVRQPRALAIDPEGRFLIVAGQLSNSVAVHAIDAASGALRLLAEYPVGRNPTWIEILAP
jgi:6-phosphogluconolactonase